VQLIDGNTREVADYYSLKIGIRSLSWDQAMQNSILINGKPLYIRGFGRHEDADVKLILNGHCIQVDFSTK